MSIKEMDRVWEASKQSGVGLLAMLALADMANNDGVCWPGQARLAERVRARRETITRIIQKCVEQGELAVMEQGGVKQNIYLLLAGIPPEEKIARLRRFKASEAGRLRCCDDLSRQAFGDVTKNHPCGDQKSPGDVIADHHSGDQRSPDPLVDPSDDPSGCAPDETSSHKPEEKPAPEPGPRQAEPPKAETTQPKVTQPEDAQPKDANPFFNAVCAVCNLDPYHLPPTVKGSAVGKVMKDLKTANWQAEDVIRYHAWRQANGRGPLGSIHWLVEEMAKREWHSGDPVPDGGCPSFGSGRRPTGTPGTIPRGMEKHNRTDIKDATPEWTETVIRAALAARQARQLLGGHHAPDKNAA